MNNKPTHTAYDVKDLEEKDGMPARGVWREIGAAWPNKPTHPLGLYGEEDIRET